MQDALRRDACVNALFYNIHTQQVEDFTERGLEDMKNKLIRTPLPPFETFNDDPLRVLRLIRFSSRLGFRIADEAQEAMRNPDIKVRFITDCHPVVESLTMRRNRSVSRSPGNVLVLSSRRCFWVCFRLPKMCPVTHDL